MATLAFFDGIARAATYFVRDTGSPIHRRIAILGDHAIEMGGTGRADVRLAKPALAITSSLAGTIAAGITAAIDTCFQSILGAIGTRCRNARVCPSRRIANVSGRRTVRIDVAFDALPRFGPSRIAAHRAAILRTRAGLGRKYMLTAAACIDCAYIVVIRKIVVVVHDDHIAGSVADANLTIAVELPVDRWRRERDRHRGANAHVTRGNQTFLHGVGALRRVRTWNARTAMSSGTCFAPSTACARHASRCVGVRFRHWL